MNQPRSQYYYEDRGLTPQNVLANPLKPDEKSDLRKLSEIAPLPVREATHSQKAIEGIMTRARKISRMEFQEPAASFDEIPIRKISSRQLEPPSLAAILAAGPTKESPSRKISQISKSSSIGSQESKSRKVSRNEQRFNHNQLFPSVAPILVLPSQSNSSDALMLRKNSPAIRRLSPKHETPVSRSNSARLRPTSEEHNVLPGSRRDSINFIRGITPERTGVNRSRRNSLCAPHHNINTRLSPGPQEEGRKSRKVSPDSNNLASLLSALTDVQQQLAVSNRPRRAREGPAGSSAAANNGRQARHRRVGVFNPGFQLSTEEVDRKKS